METPSRAGNRQCQFAELVEFPSQRHLMTFRLQEVLAVDSLKLAKGQRGYEDVLVQTDVFSKYSQAVPCHNQSPVL